MPNPRTTTIDPKDSRNERGTTGGQVSRERTSVDVSRIVLTHHKLKSQGHQRLSLGGDAEALKPLTATGTGSLQEKEKALLAEILAKLNDLFQGDVTDDDQLIYVNNVIKGKLMESETLVQPASHNSKEQFSNSPALRQAILDAVIDAFEAHSTMSKQALDSEQVRDGLREVLLGPGQLYELLRGKASGGTLRQPLAALCDNWDSCDNLSIWPVS